MRGAITPHVAEIRRRARARACRAEDGRPRPRAARDLRCGVRVDRADLARARRRPRGGARADRACTSSPTTSASRRTSCASCATSAARVTVVPATTPAREALALGPDGCLPVERPGRSGGGGVRRSRRPASCARAASRCSASAWATRSSGSRSAARLASCRSATTAATTRCSTRPPARSRSRRRTTGSSSIPRPCRRACSVTHVNLFDHSNEGHRGRRPADLQRPVPPRGEPRAARRELPVRAVSRST